MATKIRGVTVEIGGDVSGLDKALSKVNTSINTTKKELRDIERLLKLDPTNTELLRQKHQALGVELNQTKAKLESLKKAEQELKSAGVDQNTVQFRALEREIIETENALKALEIQSAQSQVALAKITAEADKIAAGADAIYSKTRMLSAGAVAVGTKALKTTADFEKELSNVEALLGSKLVDGDMERLKEKAKEVSASTKFTLSETAQAMSYMALAGWDANQIMDGLLDTMDLAAAANEDVAKTSDIVTDAITAFGLEAKDVKEFTDALAVTMSSSNTTVEMMGEAFKYVGSVAGTAGYSIEDVSLALGLMANNGIKGSMAGTALRNVIQRLAKPTKQVSEAMDALGISLTDDDGHVRSLDNMIQHLRTQFAGLSVELVDEEGNMREYEDIMADLEQADTSLETAEALKYATMIFGARAMPGILALVNTAEEDYENLKNAIYGVTDAEGNMGYAHEMAQTQLDNLDGRLTILKSKLDVAAATLGEKLTPFIDKAITAVSDLCDWFASLTEEQVESIAQMVLVVAALAPVAKGVSSVSKLVSTLTGTVIPKCMTAVGKLTGTVIPGLVSKLGIFGTLGIATLIIGLVALIVAKGDEIKKLINKVCDFCQNALDKVFEWLNSHGLGFIGAFVKGVSDFIGNVKTVLNGIIDFIKGVFSGDWSRAWKGIVEILTGLFGGIKDILKVPINAVIGLINGVIKGYNKIRSIAGKSAVSEIPMLASGGVVYNGGSAIVGEAGAELLTMQGGRAVVTPLTNNTTNNSNTNVGGVTINVYGAAGQNVRELADIIMDEMQAATERKAAVFG